MFIRQNGQPVLSLTILNQSSVPLSDFAIQFNRNSFGIVPPQPNVPISVVSPGAVAEASVALIVHPSMENNTVSVSPVIEIAMKNNVGISYFMMNFPLHVLFTEAGQLSRDDYLTLWKSIPQENLRDLTLQLDLDTVQRKLQASNVFLVARRTDQQEYLYFSSKLAKNDTILLLEIRVGPGLFRCCTKTLETDYVPLYEQSIAYILTKK